MLLKRHMNTHNLLNLYVHVCLRVSVRLNSLKPLSNKPIYLAEFTVAVCPNKKFNSDVGSFIWTKSCVHLNICSKFIIFFKFSLKLLLD